MQKHNVMRELGEHLPFSIFFTAAGITLAALLTYGAILTGKAAPATHSSCDTCTPKSADAHAAGHADNTRDPADKHEHHDSSLFIAAARMLFHIFHPIHLLLSAMATTAMFYRYERRMAKAIVVGFAGSVGICGLSDVFMPYLAGELLQLKGIHFHWCLIQHPQMVLPFAAVGIASGLVAAGTVDRSTIISHSAHIFISSTASLFYLISYGLPDWYSEKWLAPVFIIVILCVTIPCCLSDILFPLAMVSKDGEEPPSCGCHGHQH